MSIPLLRIPFLAQIEIFESMDLHDAFSLSTISKRSRESVKRGLRYQHVELVFNDNSFMIARFQDTTDNGRFDLFFDYKGVRETEQQIWNLYDRKDVCVTVRRIEHENQTNRYWPRELRHDLMKYFVELFQKHSVVMDYMENNAKSYRKTMESLKTSGRNLNFERLAVWNEDEENHNDLVKAVLMDAGGAKNVDLFCMASSNLRIDFEVQKFENLYIRNCEWVSKDKLIKLFGSCKKIVLVEKRYSNKSLSGIFKAWMAGSPAELLEIDEVDDYYDKEPTRRMLGALPGAVAIRKAEIFCFQSKNFHTWEFHRGECFMIAQTGGIKALVYQTGDGIALTTHFKNVESLELYK